MGEPSVTTRVLKSRREGKRGSQNEAMLGHGSMLLALKMVQGHINQGTPVICRAGGNKDTDSPLEPLDFDISPVNPFQTFHLQNYKVKICIIEAMKFVEICYSNNRK